MVTLVEISDRNRRTGKPATLSPLAAAAYEAAKRDGMPGDCVSDAARTNAEQAEMYQAYLRGELEATAARPGTSKHERGNAIDLKEPARSWLRARPKYGFVKDLVRNEPWHFEHDGRIIDEPTIAVPDLEIVEDDEMPWFIRSKRGAVVMVSPTGCRAVTLEAWQVWTNLGATVKYDNMDDGPFNVLIQSLGGYAR